MCLAVVAKLKILLINRLGRFSFLIIVAIFFFSCYMLEHNLIMLHHVIHLVVNHTARDTVDTSIKNM